MTRKQEHEQNQTWQHYNIFYKIQRLPCLPYDRQVPNWHHWLSQCVIVQLSYSQNKHIEASFGVSICAEKAGRCFTWIPPGSQIEIINFVTLLCNFLQVAPWGSKVHTRFAKSLFDFGCFLYFILFFYDRKN